MNAVVAAALSSGALNDVKIATLSLLNRAAEARGPQSQPSQGEALDRLGIKSGETRLARLLNADEGAGRTTGKRLLLAMNGQQVPVRSERALPEGSLVRVMRAGNELQLMEMVSSPGRSTLTQSLAQKIPAQHHLGEGLNQLLNRKPDTSIPEPARRTLQALLQTLPRLGGLQSAGAQSASTSSQTAMRQALSSAISQAPEATPGSRPAQSLQGSLQSLAPSENISGERVREWFSNSGIFREPRLITAPPPGPGPQSPTPGAGDLKAQLIKLVGQLLPTAGNNAPNSRASTPEALQNGLNGLRPATTPELTGQDALRFPAPIAPAASAATGAAAGSANAESISAGETLRLLAGMINRITVNQLHSQAASTGGGDAQTANQTWIFELPWVSSTNEVKLLQGRLEERRDEEEDDGGNAAGTSNREWRLNLALTFDSTGPIYFDVTLRGRKLSTTVWAEQSATVSLVRETRNHLETALARLDLDVDPVECLHGKPPAMVTRLSQQLVDEHA